jgi:hypothetical protein
VQAVWVPLAVAWVSHAVQLEAPAPLMLLPVQSAQAAVPPGLDWPAGQVAQLRFVVPLQPEAPWPAAQAGAQVAQDRSAVAVPGEDSYSVPAVHVLHGMHIAASNEPGGLKPVEHGPHEPVASE